MGKAMCLPSEIITVIKEKKMRACCAIVGMILVLGWSSLVSAAATYTLAPSGDAAVYSANPDTNYNAGNAPNGSSADIGKLGGNGEVGRIYFSLDLSSIPATEKVTAVTLKFNAYHRGVLAKGAPSTWSESTLTWNNQPERSTWSSWSTSDGVWCSDTWAWREISVPAAGIAEINAAKTGTFSLVLYYDGEGATEPFPWAHCNTWLKENDWNDRDPVWVVTTEESAAVMDRVADGTTSTYIPEVFALNNGTPVFEAGWINAGVGTRTLDLTNPKYNVVVSGTITGLTGSDVNGNGAWMTIGLLDKFYLDGLAVYQDVAITYPSGQYGFGMNGGLTIVGTGHNLATDPAPIKIEDGWNNSTNMFTTATSFDFKIVYGFMDGSNRDTRSIKAYWKPVGESNWRWLGTQPTLGYPINASGTHSAGYEADRWNQTMVGVMVTHDNAQAGSLASISVANMKLMYEGVKPGDANFDNGVDVGDLGILAANYGTTGGATWDKGDFNGDGNVDVGDLGILAANYGTNASNANWSADYAKVFGTTVVDEAVDKTSSSVCSGLGLPMIVGLVLMGMMLTKLDE
jgi:hypothetical protein